LLVFKQNLRGRKCWRDGNTLAENVEGGLNISKEYESLPHVACLSLVLGAIWRSNGRAEQ
jgi:hypothetical protein